MEFKHKPVLLGETIENLNIKPTGIYVDCTVGGAGHSSEIAKKLNKNGTLVCIDKDDEALEVSKARLKQFECKKIFIHSDFKNIKEILADLNIAGVDGILADLGVSSYQIDNAFRGFSYMKDGNLDMRMDKTSSLTAEYIVNNYKEEELTRILFEYGEEDFARRIIKNICSERKIAPIKTTQQLVKIIEASYPAKLLHQKGSVCKKTFQALRIETNGELETLKNVLDDMIYCLKPGGRVCIITFHSLEDRIVKNNFAYNATDCVCPKSFPVCVCNHKAIIKLINKKPIVPSKDEQQENTRSISSKLRVAQKL